MIERIVIAGGTGLLGTNWAVQLRAQYDVILLVNKRQIAINGVRTVQCDFSNIHNMASTISGLAPDLLVNMVALTNVDFCEENPSLACQINCDLAMCLAKVAADSGCPFIHISTDQLFDGSCSFVKENTQPHPLNQYGKTKFQGEQHVMRAHPSAIIVRTNFFGWGPTYRRSFSDWILDQSREGKSIKAFDDVFFTPILAETAIAACMDLAEMGATGIINIVGSDRVSKYDFARCLVAKDGGDESKVIATQIADINLIANRPSDLSLSNELLRSTINLGVNDVDGMLDRLLATEGMTDLISDIH